MAFSKASGFVACALAALLSLSALAGDFTEVRPGLHTGGQPTAEQLRELQSQGVRTVIDLRPATESRGFDEASAVREAGMQYEVLPIADAADLTPANARALKQLLDARDGQVLLHCASGNRVGALLALMAQQEEGATREQALEIGRKAGLKSLEPVVEQRLDP